MSGAGTDDASGRPDTSRPDTGRPPARPTTRDLETLARGLGRLGYPRGEALARLRAAEEEFAAESRAPSVEELIRRALRARV